MRTLGTHSTVRYFKDGSVQKAIIGMVEKERYENNFMKELTHAAKPIARVDLALKNKAA